MNRNDSEEATYSIPIEPDALNQHENITKIEPSEKDEKESKVYDDILLTFNRYEDKPMCERMKTKTIKLTQENRETLEGVNGILTEFIENQEDMTLTELNALYYSVTIIISGVNSNNIKRYTPEFDLDQTTNLKIEKIRKSFGRLKVANKCGKMTKKVKTILKEKPIERMLVTYRMYLSSACKNFKFN